MIGNHLSFPVVRILLAFVLLAAGSHKAERILWSGTADLAVGLVVFELAFAALLLSRFLPSFTWWASLLCFGAFASVAATKTLSGAEDCGCFGVVPTPPWFALSIDSAAIGALLASHFDSTSPHVIHQLGFVARLPSATGYAVLVLVAVRFAVLVGCNAMWMQSNQIDDPTQWSARRLPLLDSIDIGTELSSGCWTVVFYRHGCPLCHELLDCLSTSSQTDLCANRVAVVELPPFEMDNHVAESSLATRLSREDHGDGLTASDNATRGWPLAGRLDRGIGNRLPAPIVVVLEDGHVTPIAIGSNSRSSLQDLVLRSPLRHPAPASGG